MGANFRVRLWRMRIICICPACSLEMFLSGFSLYAVSQAIPTKTYHDTALPPHHQYLAFYRWLEESYEADAVIHFGTHGTLEFLPGKHVALSKKLLS